MGEEANHLVQLDSTVDNVRHGNQGAHVGVHLFVHQPEGQALITDQSLKGMKREKILPICTVKLDSVDKHT